MNKGVIAIVLGLSLVAGSATFSRAADSRRVSAKLIGFQEVPAISSTGRGNFRASIDGTSIQFELSYSGLESTVTQAHIHFGQTSVSGGIVIFLCSNLGNGPAGTPACPQSGTVTGTRMASDVVGGAADQGISAGEFDEVLRAIRTGNAYANVHTTEHPAGEIRGQIGSSDDDED